MSSSWETPGSGTGSPAKIARTSCFLSLSPSQPEEDEQPSYPQTLLMWCLCLESASQLSFDVFFPDSQLVAPSRAL